MNPGDDSSPPTFLPRNPDQTFDSIRGGYGGDETSPGGSGENTLPTFIFRPRADSEDPGASDTGPFVVIRRVGRGGFGEVWEAVQTSLNRRVAIKQLHIKAEDAEEAREFDRMFRQEAFTTAALDHPNIVPVYDYGTDEAGRPVLAMKLVRGDSWNAVIANDLRTLPPHEVLSKNLPILVDVTQAVVFAHDAGVVHRDLKPAQVMLGKYGEVLLMDWGLAVRTGEENEDSNLTAFDRTRIAPLAADASSPAGTPSFMAPEQTLEDGSLIGTWTDVYLLGGILYVLLTGTRPHEASSGTAAVVLAQSTPVEDPRKRAPGRQMPDDLVALAMHALKSEPRERVASARDFLKSLEEHISGSSRRKESIAITETVLARVAEMPADYATLAECLNELDRARVLWGENVPAAECREELLTAQARIALRGGDLLLARVTTERLASAEARSALHKELNDLEADRKRRERERGILRVATTALLLVMVAGGTWFLFRLSEEKQFAVAARDRADASRGRAEELLDFMIGDLRTQLQPVGRVDVLDSVGKKAEVYLASLPAQEQGSKALLQRIKTTTQLARLRVDQGELERAEELLGGLAPVIAGSSPSGDLELPWMAARAQYHAVAGRVFFDQGRLKESSAAHLAAVAEFEKLRAKQPGNAAWLKGAAENLRGSADSLNILGDHIGAMPDYERAIALYRELMVARPDDPYAAADLSKALTRYGFALKRNGDSREKFEPLVRESMALISNASDAHPNDKALRAEHGGSLGDNVAVLFDGEVSPETLSTLAKGVEIMDELVRSDSANLDWKSTAYSLKMALAQRQMQSGNKDSARPIMEEVHDGLSKMIEANPSNLPMCRDLLQCTVELNTLNEESGNPSEITRRSNITLELCFDAAFGEARMAESREPAIKIVDSMCKAAEDIYLRGEVITAVPYLETGQRYRKRLLELDLNNSKFWSNYISTMTLLGGAYAARQDVAAMGETSRGFRLMIEKAPEEIRGSEDVLLGMFLAGISAGDLYMVQGDFDSAESTFLQAQVDLLRLLELPSVQARAFTLVYSQLLRRLCNLEVERGNLQRAKEYLAEQQRVYDEAQTMLRQTGPAVDLSEDFAKISLSLAKARIQYIENGINAAAPFYQEVVAVTDKYPTSRDPRMIAFRALSLIYLGRREEAEPLVAHLREVGELPRAIKVALEDTEVLPPDASSPESAPAVGE